MRFERLDLLAFGPFDQTRLDLDGTGPALHVIYGSNEAGKSTALRAIAGFLYGIPHRSVDDHTHARQSLRIGAELCNAAGMSSYWVRRKGKKATLLDAHGQPVDEAKLAAYLHGVTEGMFHHMFGLNHETLRAGAQALLEGQGEVGESLFGAALGSPALHGVLAQFRSHAEALFTPRGRGGKLLNAALDDLKRERDKQRLALTSPDAYLAQRAELERLRAERDELTRERQRAAAEQNRLKRLLGVLPRLAKLVQTEQALAELGPPPALPSDCEPIRRQAQEQIERTEYLEQQLASQMARLQQRLANLSIRESLMQLSAETIQALNHRLGRARAALVDQPKREAQRRKVNQEARAMLQRVRPEWSFERVGELRLSTSFKARVKVLAQRYAELSANARALADSQRRLERGRHRVSNSLAELPDSAVSATLREALRHAQRESELGSKLQVAENRLAQLGASLTARLEQLPHYSASWQQLCAASWPSRRDVRGFQRRFDDLAREQQHLTEVERQLDQETERCRREMDELSLQGELPSERDLQELRQARDDIWRALRQATELPDGSGLAAVTRALDRLQESERACDGLADRLRLEASRVSRMASLRADEQSIARRHGQLAQQRQKWSEQRVALLEEWTATWAGLDDEADDPQQMLAWLDEVTEIRTLAETRGGLVLEVEAMRLRHAELVRVLSEHLKPEAGERPLDELINTAEQRVARADEATAERRELERQLRQLTEETDARRSELREHEAEHERWSSDWTEAMSKLGLSVGAVPEEALAAIEEIDQLFRLVDEGQSLHERVAGMQRDTESLAEEVRALLTQHIPEAVNEFVVDGAARLIEEHQRTEQQLREKRELETELETLAQSRDEAELARATATQTLERLMKRAGVSELAALEAAEQRFARHEALRQAVAEVSDELVALGDGADLSQLRREASGADADQVRARLSELDEMLDELNGRWQRVSEDATRCEMGLQRLDTGAAQDAQGVAATLAKIRHYSERYVRNQLAAVFLEREIEKYRAENQGPILERAGALFPRLSVGRYQGLQVDFDERDRQILVCRRHDGRKVRVEALSDGTRDQLYLSLRLASLERFTEYNEPFPVVLDDILIHFDDERARAALMVLAEFAERCQVLFFTHHQRLVHLAEATLDPQRVRFLELPRASAIGDDVDVDPGTELSL